MVSNFLGFHGLGVGRLYKPSQYVFPKFLVIFSSSFYFQDQVIKDVDKRVYQYLQTRCQLLLKSYPTTLEEDSAELHEAGKVPFIYYVSTCITQNLIWLPKGQLISKANFLFSFEPKNERNYFLISSLDSKNGSNWKK